MATELPGVLRQLRQPSATPHEIELIQAASLPSNPSSPKPKENLIIGLALGLVLGVGAALLVEALDRRLKDSADVEAASGLTALGVIPFELPGEPIPAATNPRSVRAEAYRQVRTNLAFVTDGGPPKSVIITSSASSEGKTSLAVNLAIAAHTPGSAWSWWMPTCDARWSIRFSTCLHTRDWSTSWPAPRSSRTRSRRAMRALSMSWCPVPCRPTQTSSWARTRC